MKPRRWWACPRLTQWRYMVECGDYEGSFAAFPASDPGVVGLGIAGAIGGICAGFTPGYSAQKGTSQTINASTANTTMDGQPPQAQVKD
jgi:hypothetical protein